MGKDINGKELGKGLAQRADKRYEGRYIDQYGKRRSIYGFKLTEVRKQLEKCRYEAEHGILSRDPTLTVDKWFNEWINTCKKGKIKDTTLYAYEYTYKHISEQIGRMKLSEVRPFHLQRVINSLEENGYAYSTLKLTKVTMHSLFEQAVANEFIRNNPSKGVSLPTDTSQERRVLTSEEQERFLKYALGTYYEYVFRFVLLTGLRAGEVSGMKWSNIDWDRKELHIVQALVYSKHDNKFHITTPKTKSSIRIVPLSDEAVQLLKEQKCKQQLQRIASRHWNMEKEFEDLVFTSQNGRPNGVASYNNAIKSVLRKINKDLSAHAKLVGKNTELMEAFSMHTLRHTFATRCFECGMKPKIVQEILGHATLGLTTDLYMHTTTDHLHKEMEKISMQKAS